MSMLVNNVCMSEQDNIGVAKCMWDVGYTSRQIADELEQPLGVVHRWIRSFITDEEVRNILHEMGTA